jgi:hypothetical protein
MRIFVVTFENQGTAAYDSPYSDGLVNKNYYMTKEEAQAVIDQLVEEDPHSMSYGEYLIEELTGASW